MSRRIKHQALCLLQKIAALTELRLDGSFERQRSLFYMVQPPIISDVEATFCWLDKMPLSPPPLQLAQQIKLGEMSIFENDHCALGKGEKATLRRFFHANDLLLMQQCGIGMIAQIDKLKSIIPNRPILGSNPKIPILGLVKRLNAALGQTVVR
ncbi:MAG: hypothetical protein M2R45_00582 [Verrucomicrobia subdivision 3 bacterium]|nr:hypothetical protein [Limisphaerales bacterium]MCS1413541.1 hypothetical protein [Limisphaerales bacterium]